ncbi:hypothetical protein [Klenkia soli]|nr:hypothetical protein [Klenkia soli]
MHIRLGRLILRSWRPFAMWLPAGYAEPLITYLVEHFDQRDGEVSQLGGFFSEREADACIAQLEVEGWIDLRINIVTVHHRVTDWQWNR